MTASVTLPTLTAQQLAAAGREIVPPFLIPLRISAAGVPHARPGPGLPDGDLLLECVAILRLLPGRRLVARVRGAGRDYLMKLFVGRGAVRYCARDRRGCERIAQAGVPTPALLGRLTDPLGGAAGLLFEFLDGAQPVAADDTATLARCAAELARLHAAGNWHRDLHLDNFLHAAATATGPEPGARVWMIDGDGIAGGGWPPGRRRSLRNLAVLCAQRPPARDVELPDLYRAYARARGWTGAEGAGHETELARLTRIQRDHRVRRYLAKTERNCTAYLRERSFRHRLTAVRDVLDAPLRAFVDDPEAVFRNGERLKDGNSSTVVRVLFGSRRCIVKRYNLKSPLHALRRALKPVPRYRVAWRNGQRLYFLGIPTARPLLLLERRCGPLRGVAYLVMEDLGDCTLDTAVARHGLDESRLQAVVGLFEALARAGLHHGDTKATNFIVHDGCVSLIDLDAMGTDARRLSRDIARFLRNWPDASVRARFAAALAGIAAAAAGNR